MLVVVGLGLQNLIAADETQQQQTRRNCQGAKLQVLINKNLKTAWIDIQKALDSVPHTYLLDCLRAANIPTNLIKFVERTLEFQKTNLQLNNENIGAVMMITK